MILVVGNCGGCRGCDLLELRSKWWVSSETRIRIERERNIVRE